MALRSVLILGLAGDFGRFIIGELIRRTTNFTRISAFLDNTKPLDSVKAHLLRSYSGQGIELVERH